MSITSGVCKVFKNTYAIGLALDAIREKIAQYG